MTTIGLCLEYDGSAYVGWQRQRNGVSVQETVETALERLLGEPVRLVSSGRTDAGVHARGMIACFESPRELPLTAYREGVNRLLPGDIAIREAWEAAPGFHPRFDARGKWYRYQIYNGTIRSPLVRRSSWHLRESLDLSRMAAAAAAFVGRHDFAAFRSSGCDAVTTEREIFAARVEGREELILFDVCGSGFLRNMVRVMTGTLVEIGRGRRPAGDIERLLAAGCRPEAGLTAPPQGLCLMEVWYDQGRPDGSEPSGAAKKLLDNPQTFS